jgi:hypothetical protein
VSTVSTVVQTRSIEAAVSEQNLKEHSTMTDVLSTQTFFFFHRNFHIFIAREFFLISTNIKKEKSKKLFCETLNWKV